MHHNDYLITVTWQLTSICVTIHSRPYYISAHGYLPTDYIYILACLTFPKCLKYNTLFNIWTRCRYHCTSDKIRTFFVGLLGHVCCDTNLHILFNNSWLYLDAAYNFFVVLMYMPKSIACSRCLSTKLLIFTKLALSLIVDIMYVWLLCKARCLITLCCDACR